MRVNRNKNKNSILKTLNRMPYIMHSIFSEHEINIGIFVKEINRCCKLVRQKLVVPFTHEQQRLNPFKSFTAI